MRSSSTPLLLNLEDLTGPKFCLPSKQHENFPGVLQTRLNLEQPVEGVSPHGRGLELN